LYVVTNHVKFLLFGYQKLLPLTDVFVVQTAKMTAKV